MDRRVSGWVHGLFILLQTFPIDASVLQVGPSREIKTPGEASVYARDGDIVEIDAGEYLGGVAVWRQHQLTIRGVGGRAHMKAEARIPEDKAIWVIKGSKVTIENIEFSGAHVPDENGAGIRLEGSDSFIRNCYFHDNENGILGGVGNVLIEFSEFSRNGFGDGQSHNIYIGERTQRFTLRASYSHHANVGHLVKSRAKENYVLYNRLSDEQTGASSYLIDFPNGGIAFVIGNILQQGPRTENSTLLSYGAEGIRNRRTGLFIINNTFVNTHQSGIFIRNRNTTNPVTIVNNIFAGPGKVVSGPATMRSNWNGADPEFIAPNNYDFRLTARSPVIDIGTDPGREDDFDLAPTYQYIHPASVGVRPRSGKLDIGAYEFHFGKN